MKNQQSATATPTSKNTTQPVLITVEGKLAKTIRAEAECKGMTPAAFGRMLVNAGEISTAPRTAPSKGKQAVTLAIPTRITRLLKRNEVTPEKFLSDICRAVFATDDLDDTLRALYPVAGKPGYIVGLFVVEGAK